MMTPEIKKFVSDRLEQHIGMVPAHMHDAIRLYVFEQIEPGGFLTAVLENNLKEAVARADVYNKQSIANWAEFCTWALPIACWGSPARVSNWLEQRTENVSPETDGEL